MKTKNKCERLEIHLRPQKPFEKELIEIMDSMEAEYGHKSEFIRECLHLGLDSVKTKLDKVTQHSDVPSILDELAHLLKGDKYGYRVVKTFVDSYNQSNFLTIPDSQEKKHEELPERVTMGGEIKKKAETNDANENKKSEQVVDWATMRGLAGSESIKSKS